MLKIKFLDDNGNILDEVKYHSISKEPTPLFSRIFNKTNIAQSALQHAENDFSRVNIVFEHLDGAKEIFSMEKEDFINRANKAPKMR